MRTSYHEVILYWICGDTLLHFMDVFVTKFWPKYPCGHTVPRTTHWSVYWNQGSMDFSVLISLVRWSSCSSKWSFLSSTIGEVDFSRYEVWSAIWEPIICGNIRADFSCTLHIFYVFRRYLFKLPSNFWNMQWVRFSQPPPSPMSTPLSSDSLPKAKIRKRWRRCGKRGGKKLARNKQNVNPPFSPQHPFQNAMNPNYGMLVP